MAMVFMTVLSTFLAIAIPLLLKIVIDNLSSYLLTPRRIKKIMEKQGIHGPKPRPLTGNLMEMSTLTSQSTSKDMDSIHRHDLVPRLLPYYLAWTKQYGKRFIYWNGIEPRMCLTETELIKEFLSKHSTSSGKSWMQRQGTKHFIGRGLLMANGDDWYHQRHLAAPAFIGDRLKSYGKHMVECTKQMVEKMENAIGKGEKTFEVGEYMTKLTADIISRTEFGSNYETGNQILHLLTDLQRLASQSSRNLCIPGSRFFPSKYNRDIKSLKTEVQRLLMEIIQTRKDGVELGRSSSYGNDLLGILLNEMQQKKSAKGFNLNLQLIIDECKTFFFAGHETTAVLLTWTTMLLATNTSWQDKVRAEIKQVFDGQTPTIDNLSKLTVLNMVINESLRLYPPANFLPRMAFEDMKLGDLFIPKGLSVWIPVLAIHHSKELWGDDADEFNPDRFASKPYAPGRHFIPFASGPRNCIGQSFALMEAKIILAMFISRFSFTISENYRHAPITVMTIKPKYGVQICLKPLDP